MKIAIIGAGITGLTAAHELLKAGNNVTLYEASDGTGGLARGFKDDRWQWSLERFYHHLFESDSDIISLSKEIGFEDKLFFPTPRTSIYDDGNIYPFSNPLDWWRFPALDPVNYVRFGAVGAFLRYTRFWRRLERETAVNWTRRWYGSKIFNLIWKPLLIGKFGPYYEDVNMAWLWARLHVRSFKLGYFEGGFQAFVDRLTATVAEAGAVICLEHPVQHIEQTAAGIRVEACGQAADYDQVLHTTSPALLTKIAPGLPAAYLGRLRRLQHMSAVVLTLALRRPLLVDGTYWLNLPARSPEKARNAAPFLALVEHTNYIDASHYGGDHIVYVGDYITPDHPYMQMEKEQLQTLFISAFKQFNPEFDPSWIRASWLFRAPYAQPVPQLNHSQNIPSIDSPLPGLFLASMSQVYPWDRGTNFAVQIGRQAAETMRREATRRTGEL